MSTLSKKGSEPFYSYVVAGRLLLSFLLVRQYDASMSPASIVLKAFLTWIKLASNFHPYTWIYAYLIQ